MAGKRKGKLLRIIAGFFIVMIGGTMLSRAAASVLVAQVRTERTERGRLSCSCEGEGVIVPVNEERIFLWPEQQVEWSAGQGSTVKKGECLVQFRMEYLSQTIEKKEAELTQLELQTAQQQVSAREQARVPASAGAKQTLKEAGQSLEAAEIKEAQAKKAYEESGGASEDEKEELARIFREAKEGTEAAREQYNQAQDSYSLARQEDEAQEINAANAMEAARLGAEASEVEVIKVKKELKILKAYQKAKGRLCAEKNLIVLRNDVQTGTVTNGSEVIMAGSGGFRLKGQVKEEDKEKLKVGAEAEIQLRTGSGKTAKLESFGTERDTAADRETDAPVSSVQTYWYAPLPEDTEVQGGDSFTWKIERPSEKEYEQIIPLGALREGVGDTYCLILSEEERMLGTVQTARRVPVTVLQKDAENAAVTSSLKNTDQIIISSEKYVKEGDRVRLKE